MSTWRFMGSYKRSYKPLIWVIGFNILTIVTLLITPLIPTTEPASRVQACRDFGGLGS